MFVIYLNKHIKFLLVESTTLIVDQTLKLKRNFNICETLFESCYIYVSVIEKSFERKLFYCILF